MAMAGAVSAIASQAGQLQDRDRYDSEGIRRRSCHCMQLSGTVWLNTVFCEVLVANRALPALASVAIDTRKLVTRNAQPIAIS